MQHEIRRSGLPENAKLVFKGVIFEIWQWEQVMFDGSIEVFEKAWRVPTVDVLAIVDGKVVLEEQDQPDKKNFFSLPGGRADQSDDPLVEAKRELFEETGYQAKNWEELTVRTDSNKVLHDSYLFLARNCKKLSEPQLDRGEKITLKFLELDDFIALLHEPRSRIHPSIANYFLQVCGTAEKKRAFWSHCLQDV